MLSSISRMPLKHLGLDTFLKSTGGFFCVLPSLLTTSSCELGWGCSLVWLCRVLVWLCRVPAWLSPCCCCRDRDGLAQPENASGADTGHPLWKPTAYPASPGWRATKPGWKCASSLTALWLAKGKKCGLSYNFFFLQRQKYLFILEQSLFTVQETLNYSFKPQ